MRGPPDTFQGEQHHILRQIWSDFIALCELLPSEALSREKQVVVVKPISKFKQ
jgi:hypothetical protein